jgi:apolipoprotein N-acyltransferase
MPGDRFNAREVPRSSTFTAAAVSGVLFPLALPNELFPMGNPLLGLIALSPLYLALLWAQSPRQATLIGMMFGAVSTLLSNYWLMFFGEFSIWTIGGVTIAYMLFDAILGPFLWRALRARRAYRPLLFALVWIAYELLKSVGFLGFPWGLAAYPFNMISVVVQVVDITGVWGLSLVAVYFNAVVAECFLDMLTSRKISGLSVRASIIALVLIGIVVVYGALALARDIPLHGDMDVLLVQQNSDSWNTSDTTGPLKTAQRLTHTGLEEMPGDPDLIIWSETSLRFPFDEFRRWYENNPASEPFIDFVRSLPAPIMTGAPYRVSTGEPAYHNAVLLLDQTGDVRQWYGKQHLVPFAEYVPLWQYEAVRRFFQNVVGLDAIWAPGPGAKLITVERDSQQSVRVGTPICFEDGFAYIARQFVKAGADVLINLTNAAWSQTDSAQLQHVVAARFRAVETRRSLVRATNGGLTSVIDPWGRITAEIPMFTADYLIAQVPIYRPDNEPLYVRWGEYLPIGISVGLLILLIWSTVRPCHRNERYPRR